MIDSTIPEAIVHGVLVPLGVTIAQGVPLGMSGARVYRCVLGTGETLALKQWPEEASRRRVRHVHDVMLHAVANGCSLVPRLRKVALAGGRSDTVLSSGTRHWELASWVEGAAAPISASTETIRLGARAIAQFHASVRDLGVLSQPPPAARTRLRRLRQLDAMLPRALEFADDQVKSAELTQIVANSAQLLRMKWDEVRQQITRSLSQYGTLSVNTQYVLRDVHRQHVIFSADGDSQQVSGLIDFDAIRVDTVATDLSRWAGSFLGGQNAADAVWEAALAGFRDEKTFLDGPEREIGPQLAQHLCYANTWISLANWLVWIWQRRDFAAGPSAVAARIQELMRSADPS